MTHFLSEFSSNVVEWITTQISSDPERFSTLDPAIKYCPQLVAS